MSGADPEDYALTLEVWGKTTPPQGTYAQTCLAIAKEMRRLQAVEAEAASLRAQVARMAEALRGVEWLPISTANCCPKCSQFEAHGQHSGGCPIGLVLHSPGAKAAEAWLEGVKRAAGQAVLDAVRSDIDMIGTLAVALGINAEEVEGSLGQALLDGMESQKRAAVREALLSVIRKLEAEFVWDPSLFAEKRKGFNAAYEVVAAAVSALGAPGGGAGGARGGALSEQREAVRAVLAEEDLTGGILEADIMRILGAPDADGVVEHVRSAESEEG